MQAMRSRFGFLICTLSISFIFGNGCSTAASKEASENAAVVAAAAERAEPVKSFRGPTIEIKPNSPADTVRAFYDHLREKRFRDAIFLTNLRPAVEGLTMLNKGISARFRGHREVRATSDEINGEIISGNKAPYGKAAERRAREGRDPGDKTPEGPGYLGDPDRR